MLSTLGAIVTLITPVTINAGGRLLTYHLYQDGIEKQKMKHKHNNPFVFIVFITCPSLQSSSVSTTIQHAGINSRHVTLCTFFSYSIPRSFPFSATSETIVASASHSHPQLRATHSICVVYLSFGTSLVCFLCSLLFMLSIVYSL